MQKLKKENIKFLTDEYGNRTGVLLKKNDFEKIVRKLEDYHDYKLVKKLSGKKQKTYTKEQVLAEIEKKN